MYPDYTQFNFNSKSHNEGLDCKQTKFKVHDVTGLIAAVSIAKYCWSRFDAKTNAFLIAFYTGRSSMLSMPERRYTLSQHTSCTRNNNTGYTFFDLIDSNVER